MNPEQVSNVIRQFAGYLHIPEEIVRWHIEYDGEHSERSEADALPRVVTEPPLPDFDDTYGAPVRFPLISDDHGGILDRLPLVRLAPPIQVTIPTAYTLPAKALPFKVTPPDIDAAGSVRITYTDVKIQVDYAHGGDQDIAVAHQGNMLIDVDQVTIHGDGPGSAALDPDAAVMIDHALQASADAVPVQLDLFGQDQAGMTSGIAAYDVDRAEHDPALTPIRTDGLYVDGKLATERPDYDAMKDRVPLPPEGTHNSPDHPGTVAELGGNEATNTALVVDDHLSRGDMIVMGDYFKTNAIFQTNAYSDHDTFSINGRGEHDVIKGQDVANNVAEFIHDTSPAYTGQVFAGLNWHVDTFQGDFYDIKSLNQTNWMNDADHVTQASATTYSEIQGGMNSQGNVAQFWDLSAHYDLVVVTGNYHAANLIWQTNVLYDNDTVNMSTFSECGGSGGDTNQSFYGGQNWLLNDATINNIGSGAFGSISSDTMQLIHALQNQDGTLPTDYGFLINGNGTGTLNVLLINGDYYDLNLIRQTNVIADADTLNQMLHPGADGLQYVATGGNTALNFAEIIQVDPLANTYVGGQHYEDSMLVQTEMVAPHGSGIVTNDPGQLAPEVIAFTDPQPDPGPQDHVAQASTAPTDANHDMLGHLLT